MGLHKESAEHPVLPLAYQQVERHKDFVAAEEHRKDFVVAGNHLLRDYHKGSFVAEVLRRDWVAQHHKDSVAVAEVHHKDLVRGSCLAPRHPGIDLELARHRHFEPEHHKGFAQHHSLEPGLDHHRELVLSLVVHIGVVHSHRMHLELVPVRMLAVHMLAAGGTPVHTVQDSDLVVRIQGIAVDTDTVAGDMLRIVADTQLGVYNPDIPEAVVAGTGLGIDRTDRGTPSMRMHSKSLSTKE